MWAGEHSRPIHKTVGLAKPEPEIVEVPVVEPVVEVEQVPIAVEDAFVSEMVTEEVLNVALPHTNDQTETVSAPEETIPEPTVAPTVVDESVPLPSGIPEIDDSLPIEREFRALIQELLDSGVDPADMMTDPRLEDITERALAQEFETWPVFMQMVS